MAQAKASAKKRPVAKAKAKAKPKPKAKSKPKAKPKKIAAPKETSHSDDFDSPPEKEMSSPAKGAGPNSPADEFALQVTMDRKTGRYVGTALEFPEIRVVGDDRYDVTEDLVIRVEDEIDDMKAEGESLPEPLQLVSYPDRLDVPISQNLYARLDRQSRQQRVALEQLVTEILSAGLVRKELKHTHKQQQNQQQNKPQKQKQKHKHQRRGGGGGEPNGNRREPDGNRRDGGGQRRYGRGSNQGQGDNFLEYVRSLEKNPRGGGGSGGGGGRNWRKGR